MIQTVTTKKPTIPSGYRKLRFCTGGYKPSIIGKTVECDNPVWAEARYSPGATFAADRKWYRLYTFVKY